MIEERAAVGALIQGPSRRVNHKALLVLFRRDLPQFLDANAVGLRFAIGAQAKPIHQLPAELTAAPFGKKCISRVQFDPWGVIRCPAAIARDAHIAGRHAFNTAVRIVEHLGGGETGIDFNAQRFGLFTEPAAKTAKGNNVVSTIVHRRRQQDGWHR